MNKLLGVFLTFFKIGLFTIGGGYVMIPMMQREFVEKQGWVSEEKMLNILSVTQALPGVVAINSSIYVGYEILALKGAAVAALGMILPSFIIILAVYYALNGVQDSFLLEKFYTGIRAAIVALIALTALRLGKKAVKDYFGLFIALFATLATSVLKLDLILIMLLCGFSGYFYYTIKERGLGK